MTAKRKIIPYNPDLKALANQLRKNMTLSEVLLWNELKQRNISGYDFDRQRPIDNFIVDFYCKELSLAIEIDGDTHIYRYDYDDERQRVLENLGVHFLRFEDIEVKKNMNNVIRVIEDWIEKNKPPTVSIGEGSFIEKDLTKNIKPTPNPSREGNFTIKDSTSNIKLTPGSSREGNFTIKDSTINIKLTPGSSREGNFTIKDSTINIKLTPGSSREGNLTY